MKIEDEMNEYVKTLSTDNLVEIINKLENYELVSSALIELGDRDEVTMVNLSNDILINQKGDKYLQAMAFSFVYTRNPYLAIKSIYERISKMDEILLRAVMEEFVVDCFQEISSQFTPYLLRMIRDRYAQLDNEKKEYIRKEYLEFMKEYKDRM